MSDRELLELAAKAAGQDYWLVRLRGVNRSVTEHMHYKGKDGETLEWNPLKDDGDALRLAVKLDIEFYQGDDDGPSVYAGYWGKSERRDVTRLCASEPISDDPSAATRRAIVRAAAEIGKDME
jgi:hypothetical protein